MKNDNKLNIYNNDPKKFELKNKDLKLIIITCLISAITIMLINNTGINSYTQIFTIPLIVMLIGYLFLINKNNLVKNQKAYILLIPIILILLSDIIMRIDFSNQFLNIILLPILGSTFFFLLINPNYKITRESLGWIFKLFPKNIFYNLKHIKSIFNFKDRPKTNMVLNIIGGCLIGIPIAIILLSLLADADQYFNQFVHSILNFIKIIFNNDFLFSNIFIGSVSFIMLFSVFINLFKNKDNKLKEIPYKEVNSTITSTILIIINTVFILFLISEISKITGNFLQLPVKYTYAKYAREGFFQLLAVTIINFGIILYYVYNTEIIKKNSMIKKLILLLIGFSIILVFSSYYRMVLYIIEYGFTILRLQVILFLAMEFSLFGVLVKKILFFLKYKDAPLFLSIILIFYILNIYLCTSSFIELLNIL